MLGDEMLVQMVYRKWMTEIVSDSMASSRLGRLDIPPHSCAAPCPCNHPSPEGCTSRTVVL